MHITIKKQLLRVSKKRSIVLALYAIAVIIMVLPFIIRMHADKPYIIGEGAAYNLRMYNLFADFSIITKDPFSHTNILVFNWYYFLAGKFFSNLSCLPSIIIVMLLEGIVALLLIDLILKKAGFNRLVRINTSLLLIMTPVFITSFMQFSIMFAAVDLILLSVYLFLSKHRTLSFFCLLAVASLGFVFALFSLFLFMIYIIKCRQRCSRFICLLFVSSIVGYLFYVIAELGIPVILKEEIVKSLFNIISDLGSIYGVGLFTIILGLIGVVVSWPRKKDYYGVYIVLLVSYLFGVFFNSYFYLVTAICLAFLGAITLDVLLNMSWDFNFLFQLTLIILYCGLLFSTLAYLNTIPSLPPDKLEIECLGKLSYYPKGDVLSVPSNGDFISYFSRHRPFIDDHYLFLKDYRQRLNITNYIFNLGDINLAKKYLTENKIRYIFIDSRMENGLVWDSKDQGLSYLLRNNETFIKLCSNPYSKVFMVK